MSLTSAQEELVKELARSLVEEEDIKAEMEDFHQQLDACRREIERTTELFVESLGLDYGSD